MNYKVVKLTDIDKVVEPWYFVASVRVPNDAVFAILGDEDTITLGDDLGLVEDINEWLEINKASLANYIKEKKRWRMKKSSEQPPNLTQRPIP